MCSLIDFNFFSLPTIQQLYHFNTKMMQSLDMLAEVLREMLWYGVHDCGIERGLRLRPRLVNRRSVSRSRPT